MKSGHSIGLVTIILASLLVYGSFVSEEFTDSVVWNIGFGWILFARRVLPQVHVRWDGIAFFLFYFVLAMIAAHSFLGWVYRSVTASKSMPAIAWRLRWTVAILLVVLMIFGIGLSFAGVVHQVGWIATSPSPWFVSKIQSPEDQLLSGYDPSRIEDGPFRESWTTAIMPFLPGIVEVKDKSKAWNHPSNASQFQRAIHWSAVNSSLAGPIKSPDGYGLAHFAANQKIIETNRRVTWSNLREGTSNTYMIGECNAGFLPWGRVGNTRNLGLGIRQDWNGAKIGNVGYGPVAGHKSMLFAMCDGSIRTIDVKIDSSVLIAMDSDPSE